MIYSEESFGPPRGEMPPVSMHNVDIDSLQKLLDKPNLFVPNIDSLKEKSQEILEDHSRNIN